MNQDDIRKRIIKDKFDKLTPYVFGWGRQIKFLSHEKKTLGVDIHHTYVPDPSFTINGEYFMFKFIGIDNEEEKNKYGSYILKLVMDKFPFVKYNLDADDFHYYVHETLDDETYDVALQSIEKWNNNKPNMDFLNNLNKEK